MAGTTPVEQRFRFGSLVPTSDIARRERLSFGGKPAADGADDALLSPDAHDNRCRLVHLVSSLGHTNRKPLERRAGAIAKRWEAEDFAAPSTQDKLPTIEARRDSSIQTAIVFAWCRRDMMASAKSA